MTSKLSTISELIKANTVSDAVTPITLTANTAVYIPVTGRSILIGVTAGATGTIAVAKGDGIAATNDLSFSVTKDKVSFIQLDTSSFEYTGEADSDGDTHFIKLTPGVAGTLVAVNPL